MNIPTPIPRLLLSVPTVFERTVTLLLLLVELWLHRCALILAVMNGLALYVDGLGIGRMLRRVHSSMAGVRGLMTPELTILYVLGALLGPCDRMIPVLTLIRCSLLVMNLVDCPTRLVATFLVETDPSVIPWFSRLMMWLKLVLICVCSLLENIVATTSSIAVPATTYFVGMNWLVRNRRLH